MVPYRSEFKINQSLEYIWSKKKHQISDAALKMSLENGGLILTDIENKNNTQRIKLIFHLILLDREDFTKVVASEIIRKLNAEYEGLDIFKADINKMKPNVLDPFYKDAVSACQKI